MIHTKSKVDVFRIVSASPNSKSCNIKPETNLDIVAPSVDSGVKKWSTGANKQQ